MADLKTNYVDDKLDASKNQLRKYQQIQNDDGTVSFVDVTDYTATGTSFGASDINATNTAVNKNTADISSLNLNIKNLSDYCLSEINTGKTWITGKPIYRKVIECGALPNSSSKNVETGVDVITQITSFEFLVINPEQATFLTINAMSNNMKAFVSNRRIIIETSQNYSNLYTRSYAVLEYTK